MHIYSGQFKNRIIASPKGLSTRPTSGRMRETLFNICQSLVEGARFLDLFAGSGAMGLEALSRGAAKATFVDSSMDSIRCIKENLKNFQMESAATVIHADVFTALDRLQKNGQSFDLVYADPPYEHGENFDLEILAKLDEGTILNPDAWVYLEESSKIVIPFEDLKHLRLNSYRKTGRSSLYEFKYHA
jgi:16S rRNA (guanine966-N2)-methyltransferase